MRTRQCVEWLLRVRSGKGDDNRLHFNIKANHNYSLGFRPSFSFCSHFASSLIENLLNVTSLNEPRGWRYSLVVLPTRK